MLVVLSDFQAAVAATAAILRRHNLLKTEPLFCRRSRRDCGNLEAGRARPGCRGLRKAAVAATAAILRRAHIASKHPGRFQPQSRYFPRVNPRRDDMSPVGASMYCSPHPAALHIAPAARLREFCLYDSALGSFITVKI